MTSTSTYFTIENPLRQLCCHFPHKRGQTSYTKLFRCQVRCYIGNLPAKYYPYSIINPDGNFSGIIRKITPLDWAGIDLIKKLTEYYGDGVTRAVYSIGEYSFNELQGYYNNKVAVPNQNNIQKEFYVEPPDEPNE